MPDIIKFAIGPLYIEEIPRIIIGTFASFSCFFVRGKCRKNFRFDIFLAITQEPQAIWKFWSNIIIWIPWRSLHKICIFLWKNILQFFSKTNKLENMALPVSPILNLHCKVKQNNAICSYCDVTIEVWLKTRYSYFCLYRVCRCQIQVPTYNKEKQFSHSWQIYVDRRCEACKLPRNNWHLQRPAS